MSTRIPSPSQWCIWAIIVVAAACSGGAEQENAPGATTNASPASRSAAVKTDNACELLAKEDARAVLGSPIEDVSDESRPSPIGTLLRGSCFYRSEDGGSVKLTIDTYDNAQTAEEKFTRLRKRYRGGKDVAGLGDAAFVDNQAMVVHRGNVHLMIDLEPEGANEVTSYSDTKQMDALLALQRQVAVTALQRLPAGGGAAVASARQPALSARSACSLVTKAEMENILGGPLSNAVPNDSPAQTVCTYAGTGGRYAQLTIEWQGGESGMEGTRLAGALMGQAAGAVKATTAVEGLGDEAVMLIGGVLNVRKGPALITVDLRMQNDYEVKAKTIAEKVIAKI